MADDSERVIPATPRRREAARRQGTMPTAVLPAWVATAGTAVWLLPAWAAATMPAATDLVAVAIAAAAAPAPPNLWPALVAVTAPTAAVVAAAAAVGLGVRFLLDGFSWQPARLAIDYRRIDPIAGLARIFSWRSLAAAFGGGTALAALGMAAVFAIGPVALSSRSGPAEHLTIAAAAWRSAVWLFAAAAVVAGCRWLFARRRFERQIRMTPEEFAEETRSAQADPKVKLLQRQKPRQPAA